MLIWSRSTNTLLFFLFILLNMYAEFDWLRPFQRYHEQRKTVDDFAFMPLSLMPQKLMLNFLNLINVKQKPYISLILINFLVMAGHGLSGENKIELIQEV